LLKRRIIEKKFVFFRSKDQISITSPRKTLPFPRKRGLPSQLNPKMSGDDGDDWVARVSVDCPVSKSRIKIPGKGRLVF
jgi:hypothetical protein